MNIYITRVITTKEGSMLKISTLTMCMVVLVMTSVCICYSMEIITYDVSGIASEGGEVYGEITTTDDATILTGWVEYKDGRRDHVVGTWSGMGVMEVVSNSTYKRYILHVEE